jgi:RNase P subunit RPR2
MKGNAILVIENSTAVPFKWHRRSYLCFFCHLPLNTSQSLREHTKSDHTESSIRSAVAFLRRDEKVKIDISTLDCKCGDSFRELNIFIEHLKVAHRKKFTDDCGYGVIPYRLDGDTFHCALCKEEFQYFTKLNQHMNEHYGSYVCEICGKSFLSQDRLRCHSLRHGSGFKCGVCAESFDTLAQKNNHESKVHNKDKRVKCSFCSETFANYILRKKHHNVAHSVEIPEFNCPECGKVFHIMSKMQVHLKEVHIREKNFSCTVCDQRFFSKTLVQKHMVKHFGERVFQCNVCMKSYPRKQTLKDHMRIHSDDKRLICSVCSQTFVQNSSLRAHMKSHHPESASV